MSISRGIIISEEVRNCDDNVGKTYIECNELVEDCYDVARVSGLNNISVLKKHTLKPVRHDIPNFGIEHTHVGLETL